MSLGCTVFVHNVVAQPAMSAALGDRVDLSEEHDGYTQHERGPETNVVWPPLERVGGHSHQDEGRSSEVCC